MKFVIQVVDHAQVSVDGEVIGKIGKGFMVLCGVAQTDTKEIADKMVRKMCNLRIFEDENGKTNLSLADVGGALLLISQFTLYADCHKGNRPSFINAARPDTAEPLYELFNTTLREQYGLHVETGRFGADMKIDFINDGPVTIIIDSENLKRCQ